MMYPYIRYNDEADAEAHVRAFLITWEANQEQGPGEYCLLGNTQRAITVPHSK